MPIKRLSDNKKKTESQWIAEFKAIDPATWAMKLMPSKFFEKVYRISQVSLRNYRSGYYFVQGEKHWITPLHETLKHMQPGVHPMADTLGGSVKMTVRWMNEWLRKIDRESKIPKFLKHL